MLAVAISLEIVAFAAMFSLGGVALGGAVLGVAAVILIVSLAAGKREARVANSRRVWTYFVVNDRLSERARIKGRGESKEWNLPASPASGVIYFDGLTATRSARWQGRN